MLVSSTLDTMHIQAGISCVQSILADCAFVSCGNGQMFVAIGLLALKVRARFVEKFSMGTGGEAGSQIFKGLDDKVSWVEKFLRVGAVGMEAAQDEGDRWGTNDIASNSHAQYRCLLDLPVCTTCEATVWLTHLQHKLSLPVPGRALKERLICPSKLALLLVGRHGIACRVREHNQLHRDDLDVSRRPPPQSSIDLKVGVLHYTPGQEPFPLLSDPTEYVPDTVDITDRAELNYWTKILSGQLPMVAEKAIATEGGTEGKTLWRCTSLFNCKTRLPCCHVLPDKHAASTTCMQCLVCHRLVFLHIEGIPGETRRSSPHRSPPLDRLTGISIAADAKRRASAFRQAFAAQLAKLQDQPAAYGKLGLGELFEMREECLREFGFSDVYRFCHSMLCFRRK